MSKVGATWGHTVAVLAPAAAHAPAHERHVVDDSLRPLRLGCAVLARLEVGAARVMVRVADEDCRQDLVVQMLLEVLARRAPHDVVAEAEGHGALVFPWLDDLGRLM